MGQQRNCDRTQVAQHVLQVVDSEPIFCLLLPNRSNARFSEIAVGKWQSIILTWYSAESKLELPLVGAEGKLCFYILTEIAWYARLHTIKSKLKLKLLLEETVWKWFLYDLEVHEAQSGRPCNWTDTSRLRAKPNAKECKNKPNSWLLIIVKDWHL